MKICALVPKIFSMPHFLDAPAVVQDHVKGLKPDALKHRSYIEIDPATGLILNYRIALQFNEFIKISELKQ